MKKFIAFPSVLFFTSCGNNAETKINSTTDSTTKKEIKDPEAAKGLKLIAASDCFTCHKLFEASVGPPYSAIVFKYKTIHETSMDSMVTQIIKGGKGRWGNIPMTAHPTVSKEDAETMVHYIMSIKQ